MATKIREYLPGLPLAIDELRSRLMRGYESDHFVAPGVLIEEASRLLATTTKKLTCTLFVSTNALDHLTWPLLEVVANENRIRKTVQLITTHSLTERLTSYKRLVDALRSFGFEVDNFSMTSPDEFARLPSHLQGRLAVFDDRLLLAQWPPKGRKTGDFLISVDPSVVGGVAEWTQRLRTSASTGVTLSEPMLLSAPIAREVAPVLCAGSVVDKDDCSWYHGIWQYLRLFDVVSTPSWHASFYLEALASACESLDGEAVRVLISGAADYSMLAYVLSGLPDAQVVVNDLCETSLLLSRWYAKGIGREIETIRGDVRTLSAGEFDVIVSDAFLTRFAASEKTTILSAWKKLLAPGGKVVTTARVDASAAVSGQAANSNEEIDAFARRVGRRAERWEMLTNMPAAEAEWLASIYARRMSSHSFPHYGAIREEVQHAGYDIYRAELAPVPGELRESEYARLVLQVDPSSRH